MLHLIHPALVHFAVTFVVAGAVFEIWGNLRCDPRAERFGDRLLALGLAAVALAVASGYLAAKTLPALPPDASLLEAHERNGLILLGLLLAGQFWKAWAGGRLTGHARLLYAALLAGVLLVAAYSAWLGGQMVYVQGIGVR